MMLHISVPALGSARAGRISGMILLRIALAAALIGAMAALMPAFAGSLRLRAEVSATGEVLTLADLVEGATGAAGTTPLFRAPPLGETGTIQAARVVEAAERLGVALDTAGRSQVVVTRPARRIGAAEIEAAVKQAVEAQHGIDARMLSLVLDSAPPALLAPAGSNAPVVATETIYDRRSRRVLATVSVGPETSVRVAGALVELVEVAVLNRALQRGEAIQAGDVAIERRARESIPADAASDASLVIDRVARRALPAGTVLRAADVTKPEVVARGEVVTVVYEVPGMTLTLRARANDGGAQGDTISVTNLQSKKTLQATVAGPGRVTVGAPAPGRLADNAAARSTLAR